MMEMTAWEQDRWLGMLMDINRCADALERIADHLEGKDD